ncbi:MAG: hypothetical protein ACRDFB_05045 [Rhabdochlamydiaceae bacterium]
MSHTKHEAPAVIALICGGIGALLIFLVLVFLPIIPPSQKYDISVDPIMIKDSLGTETHVGIKNTGMYALTNIRVEYGGTAKPDVIPKLNPGEKIILSPPEGSDLTMVRVTTDQGIDVSEPYRIPASPLFSHM